MSIEYGRIGRDQAEAFRPLLPEGRQTLHGKNELAIGAVEDGRACGVLVVRTNEMVADILHLAVSEPYQRRGIADGMLDLLCRTAGEAGVAVLCSFAAAGRDDPLCRLLTHRGDFTLTEEEDYICRFPCDRLAEVNLRGVPSAPCIRPFYSLPEYVQNDLFSYLERDNAEFARGLREERGRMLQPLCLCALSNHGVQAAVFCQNRDGSVLLSFACARTGHVRALMQLLERLRELLVKAADRVPYLYLAAVTPESRKLIEALLPDREITSRFYTAGWDMTMMEG